MKNDGLTPTIQISKNSALVLVDLQNDFFPGGALGVPSADADTIILLANELSPLFPWVIATQDWHPKNHRSFVTQHPGHQLYDVISLNNIPQILWPEHCVQGTFGAKFHSQLNQQAIHQIIHKGTDPNIDSYSTFFDNKHLRRTGLEAYLKDKGITEVFIMGLATDYCVLYSVLDSLALGFKTYVIVDGCRGINKEPQDIEKALKKMQDSSATLITSDQISAF